MNDSGIRLYPNVSELKITSDGMGEFSLSIEIHKEYGQEPSEINCEMKISIPFGSTESDLLPEGVDIAKVTSSIHIEDGILHFDRLERDDNESAILFYFFVQLTLHEYENYTNIINFNLFVNGVPGLTTIQFAMMEHFHHFQIDKDFSHLSHLNNINQLNCQLEKTELSTDPFLYNKMSFSLTLKALEELDAIPKFYIKLNGLNGENISTINTLTPYQWTIEKELITNEPKLPLLFTITSSDKLSKDDTIELNFMNIHREHPETLEFQFFTEDGTVAFSQMMN